MDSTEMGADLPAGSIEAAELVVYRACFALATEFDLEIASGVARQAVLLCAGVEESESLEARSLALIRRGCGQFRAEHSAEPGAKRRLRAARLACLAAEWVTAG